MRCATRALSLVLLLTALAPAADAKMIADSIVIFAAINGVNGTANDDAFILYNPTPDSITLNNLILEGGAEGNIITFAGNDTISPFGFLFVGDGSTAENELLDMAATDAIANTIDSVSLYWSGGPILDWWALSDATNYHGDKKETSPLAWGGGAVFIFRRPVVLLNYRQAGASDSPVFGGGGMINRLGDSDLYHDTRTTDPQSFLNRKRGFTDRMAFQCTATPLINVGTRFSMSCTAHIKFGKLNGLNNWEGTPFYDSIVPHYTGSKAWADITSSTGTLIGLGGDSTFTNGVLNNYIISIVDAFDTITLTVADAYCTGYASIFLYKDTRLMIVSPNSNDTVGGRRAVFDVRLNYPGATICTAIIEYDTTVGSDPPFDSMTFFTDSGGAQARGPGLDAGGDSTPLLASDTFGELHRIRWNVRFDMPDTRIPRTQIRIRCFNAATGEFLSDTTLDSVGIQTIFANRPDTPDAKTDPTDTVMISWYHDTDAKYYTVWRDTGYPPNDTERFVNVTLALTGLDSRPDNFYYNASLGRFRLIDTAVGQPPGERSPRFDSYFVWYITAVDTYDNQQEFLTEFTDSLSAEYLYARKFTDSISTRGAFPGETIPGATIIYRIDLSNTEGYSPAYNVSVIDFIPALADYRGTKVTTNTDLDTRHGYITQTDTADGDHVTYKMDQDSFILQIDTPLQPFNAGDTARIRFRVVVR
ncbi:MAG: hypothetical protein A3G34_02505 [Candidatus Lindowbacteria bacterium RIFCSPLOWO2_12_FULL_62_27]|nr:MAG: hypothetical protein A3G34_02505 [Candidatus Lindowbacteria bacterium RIFCSPLOWO2_12_FULL_62_27]OGH63667.1 MAG: hypothetical protein A3I06_04905 [Candidatus Lindowbacteria bacterium RIFCSPLOWO2_02_FULL_62_12]